MPIRPSSDLAAQIGTRARQARLTLKLTQADVAETVDLATEVYGRLERGNMMPSVPTLVRMAAALKVTPNDLLAGARAVHGDEITQRPQRSDLRLIVERLEGVKSVAELRRIRQVVNAVLSPAKTQRAQKRKLSSRR